MKKADTPTDNEVGGEWQDYLLVYSDPEMESDEDGSEVITTPEQGKVLRRQDESETSSSESGSEMEGQPDTEFIWSQEDDQQQEGCALDREKICDKFRVKLRGNFVSFQVALHLVPQKEVVEWLCQYFDASSIRLHEGQDVYYVYVDRRWASTRNESDWVEYVVKLLTSIC